MSVLIKECAAYPTGVEKHFKFYPRKKQFTKNSDCVTDDIEKEIKTGMNAVYLTQNDLKFVNSLKNELGTKLLENAKVEDGEKPSESKWKEKEQKLAEIVEVDGKEPKLVDIFKIEKDLQRDLKPILKTIDEKELKLSRDVIKKEKKNKVFFQHSEELEGTNMADKKTKDEVTKPEYPKNQPFLDKKIFIEDVKKRTFGQNNGRRPVLIDEDPKKLLRSNVKDEETENNLKIVSKSEKITNNVKNVKNISTGTSLSTQKTENNIKSPAAEKKIKQKKSSSNSTEEKTEKKILNKKSEKIIQPSRNAVPKKASTGTKRLYNMKRIQTRIDTGLNKLRNKNKKIEIAEPVKEKVIEEKAEKNKKIITGTNPRPFSFEVREKELLQRKEKLAKMGAEKKYEIRKWARSPEILKKKPFSIHISKRYILPEFNLKFRTDERIEKRPNFDEIVSQKQKYLQQMKLLSDMVEIREFRKRLIHNPTPIPENIMRLLQEAKNSRSDNSTEMTDNDDLFSNSEYYDVDDKVDDSVSNMMSPRHKRNRREESIRSEEKGEKEPDREKLMTEKNPQTEIGSTNFSSIDNAIPTEQQGHENIDDKNSVDNSANGTETPTFSSGVESKKDTNLKKISECIENTKLDSEKMKDTSESDESTLKIAAYNLLFSVFKKKYSS